MLHKHFAKASQTPHNRSTRASRSLPKRFTIDFSRLLFNRFATHCYRLAVTAQTLRNSCPNASQSLLERLAISIQYLRKRIAIALLTLR
jgi:hypothetical protein